MRKARWIRTPMEAGIQQVIRVEDITLVNILASPGGTTGYSVLIIIDTENEHREVLTHLTAIQLEALVGAMGDEVVTL